MKASRILELISVLERKVQVTLLDLYRWTDRYNRLQSKIGRIPPPHQHLRILEWKLVPRVGMKSFLVTALVEPGTPERNPKRAVIQFYDVEYKDWEEVKNDPGWVRVPVSSESGGVVKYIGMKRLNARTNPVKVRCSCEDFYFRFAWYVWEVGALYGKKPRPYVRKTTTWPSVNKYKIPGLCKHLWNLARALKESGLLVGLTLK